MSKNIELLNGLLALSSSLGLILSIYTYYVEYKMESNEDYAAMCDIDEHISCTKVFKSEYAKGFGLLPEASILNVPNCLYGIPHYALLTILAFSTSKTVTKISFFLIILANCATPYLAYLLFVLKNICIICISTYAINFISLLLIRKKYNVLNRIKID